MTGFIIVITVFAAALVAALAIVAVGQDLWTRRRSRGNGHHGH